MTTKYLLFLVFVIGLTVLMSYVTLLAEGYAVPMWVHRARLAYTGRSSGGSDDTVACIHIRDATLDMVEGATVFAVWTTPDEPHAVEVVTNSQGIAVFRLWEGRGEYQLCVADVTKDGWLDDPDLNFDADCPLFVIP